MRRAIYNAVVAKLAIVRFIATWLSRCALAMAQAPPTSTHEEIYHPETLQPHVPYTHHSIEIAVRGGDPCSDNYPVAFCGRLSDHLNSGHKSSKCAMAIAKKKSKCDAWIRNAAHIFKLGGPLSYPTGGPKSDRHSSIISMLQQWQWWQTACSFTNQSHQAANLFVQATSSKPYRSRKRSHVPSEQLLWQPISQRSRLCLVCYSLVELVAGYNT